MGLYRKEWAERRTGIVLWGYPDLAKQFKERVQPALVEELKKDELFKVLKSLAERELALWGFTHRREPELEVAGEIPPKSSQRAFRDNGSGHSDVNQRDEQQGSKSQGNDCPPTLEKDPRLTALEPTSGDLDLPMGITDIHVGKGSTLSERIGEIISTPENEKDRSLILQIKVDSGE